MSLAAVAGACAPECLAVLGAFHPSPDDGAPPDCATLVLLGPVGAGFWRRFAAAPEMHDGRPDPLDRWSRRVIGSLAGRLGAAALYPFGGAPFQPFTAWARRSGRAWLSPVGLLVHDTAGLMVSYRGALALPDRLDLSATGRCPCETCAAPCITACPAGALTAGGYDLDACHCWLDTAPGQDCLLRGCAVRRACPVGAGARPEAQSSFHMAAFHARERE